MVKQQKPTAFWLTAVFTLLTAGVYAGTAHLSEVAIHANLAVQTSGPSAKRARALNAAMTALSREERALQQASTQYQDDLGTDQQVRAIATNTNDQLTIDGLTPAKLPAQPRTLPGFASTASTAVSPLQPQTAPPPVQAVTGAS